MAYTITKDRVKFIEENWLYAFVFTPFPQPRNVFETMINPWEIHYFVSQFNWGSDPTVLEWIANSQLCDKATALMIFWRACPGFYTRYATQKEADADYNSSIYKIVRNMQSKWESNFYTNQQIAYDPYVDVSPIEIDLVYPNAKWLIPDYLKKPLLGEELIVEQ